MPPARIEWSAWVPFESSLCLSAPCQSGLFVIAERVVPHNIAPHGLAPNAVANTQPHLAVLKIGQAKDLGFEMGRLCSPYSPLHARVTTGRCMVRFAAVEDAVQRTAAHAALQQWFTNSGSTTNMETSTDVEFPPDLAAVQVPPHRQSENQQPETQFSAEPLHSDSAHKRKNDNPAPLP
jgi:hypothetical protein